MGLWNDPVTNYGKRYIAVSSRRTIVGRGCVCLAYIFAWLETVSESGNRNDLQASSAEQLRASFRRHTQNSCQTSRNLHFSDSPFHKLGGSWRLCFQWPRLDIRIASFVTRRSLSAKDNEIKIWGGTVSEHGLLNLPGGTRHERVSPILPPPKNWL